jgi:Protein of unknown function (DUF3761)
VKKFLLPAGKLTIFDKVLLSTTAMLVTPVAIVMLIAASGAFGNGSFVGGPPAPAVRAQLSCTRSDEANLANHSCYINRNSTEVHSPSRTNDGNAPSDATARCADGSYSYSQNHSGTCSHHGGVDQWRKR